jgi:hypothetical protein
MSEKRSENAERRLKAIGKALLGLVLEGYSVAFAAKNSEKEDFPVTLGLNDESKDVNHDTLDLVRSILLETELGQEFKFEDKETSGKNNEEVNKALVSILLNMLVSWTNMSHNGFEIVKK